MRFPVGAQHGQGRSGKRHHAVLGALAAVDMDEHPVAVDVAHFEVKRLLEAKSAGVDGDEIGVVVGSTHLGEEFCYLLFGNQVGGLAVEIHQHSHHAGVGLPRTFGQPCEL